MKHIINFLIAARVIQAAGKYVLWFLRKMIKPRK